MQIKKFTTYEFDIDLPSGSYAHIIYKKDETNKKNSIIDVNFYASKSGEPIKNITLEASFLIALCEAMKEVDPFGFTFEGLDLSNVGELKKEE